MKNIENKITEFANTFNYLNDMAYINYKQVLICIFPN